jgi:hypothetical protein
MHSVRYAMKAEGKTFLDDYELTPAAHRGIAKGTQDYQDFVKNATDAFQNGRYRHAPDVSFAHFFTFNLLLNNSQLQDGTPFLYRNLAYRRFVYRFLYASHLRIGKRHGDMFLFGLPHGLLAMLHIAVIIFYLSTFRQLILYCVAGSAYPGRHYCHFTRPTRTIVVHRALLPFNL